MIKPLQFGWTVFSQQVRTLSSTVLYISFYTTGVFDTRWTQISNLQIKLTLRLLCVFEIDTAELMESPIFLAAQKVQSI